MNEEAPQLTPEDWRAFDQLPPQVKWFMTYVMSVTPVPIVLDLYEQKVAGGMDTLRADQQVVAALKHMLKSRGVMSDFRPCEKKGSKYAGPPTYIGSTVRSLEQAGWELG